MLRFIYRRPDTRSIRAPGSGLAHSIKIAADDFQVRVAEAFAGDLWETPCGFVGAAVFAIQLFLCGIPEIVAGSR